LGDDVKLKGFPLGANAGRIVARATFTIIVAAGFAQAELPPLIPREVFFPVPAAMQAPRLSPNGRWLSYLAEDSKSAVQLWLRDLDRPTARQLTRIPPPGIKSYIWAENNRIICYEQRHSAGSRLIGLDFAAGTEQPLITIEGATFGNLVTRPGIPDEMLVSLRQPGATEDDVYRLNVITGAFVLDTKNPGGVRGDGYIADSTLRVRAVRRNTADGGNEVLVRDGPSDSWRSWLTADSTHNLRVDAFNAQGTALLLRTDLGADKERLISRTIRGGTERTIAAASDLDLENVLLQPQTNTVQAVSFLRDPRRWMAFDPLVAEDLRRIGRIAPGQVSVASRDRSGARWLVWIFDDRSAPRLYFWDRATQKLTLLLETQPQLAGLPLAHVEPVSFKARDGLRIHGYLTLPIGVPARRLPLVLWIHGGPYLRDAWGYDNIGQFFANRGYAFMRINYRGSRGFGRRFRLASFKQWGRAMQDDIVDAVSWIVQSGIADRTRMAVLGHSYGGYAALAALTLTPDLFACGAASSTVANLLTFVNQFPKTPGNAWVRTTIGDPENPEDAQILRSVSPIFLVERLSKPLLIAKGDGDGALPQGDLETFVAAARKRGQKADLVVYEGDGHFFRRENELDFFARAETLFARYLGGRAQPFADDRYPGSTARVNTLLNRP
jgi:dipeptidyl aminopeptidase/acylaminoacyl peptidase